MRSVRWALANPTDLMGGLRGKFNFTVVENMAMSSASSIPRLTNSAPESEAGSWWKSLKIWDRVRDQPQEQTISAELRVAGKRGADHGSLRPGA